jgi:hypothetical protein
VGSFVKALTLGLAVLRWRDMFPPVENILREVYLFALKKTIWPGPELWIVWC